MSNMSDKRLKNIILEATEANIERADIIILGVPTDEGITRNGGRPGASLAPDAIRACHRAPARSRRWRPAIRLVYVARQRKRALDNGNRQIVREQDERITILPDTFGTHHPGCSLGLGECRHAIERIRNIPMAATSPTSTATPFSALPCAVAGAPTTISIIFATM